MGICPQEKERVRLFTKYYKQGVTKKFQKNIFNGLHCSVIKQIVNFQSHNRVNNKQYSYIYYNIIILIELIYSLIILSMDKYILIPDNLDLDTLILNHPISIKKDIIYCFIYFIHKTYIYDKEGINHKGLVYIHNNSLKTIHTNYKTVINWLKENKIIDVYESYSESLYPKSYKLSDYYLFSKPKKVIITDNIANRKINTFNPVNEKDKNKYTWLFNNIHKSDFTINRVNFETLINKLFEQDLKIHTKTEVYRKLWERVLGLEILLDKNIWFTVDDFGNRLHTNISSIKKEVRELLTIDKKQLGEVDISCSQPFFLLPVLETTLKSNKSFFNLEEINDYTAFKTSVLQGTLYDYFIFCYKKKYGDNGIQNYVELMLKLRQLTLAGRFKTMGYGQKGYRLKYSSGGKWIPDDLRGKSDRDISKTMIFNVLYGKQKDSKGPKTVFKESFPTVWALIGIIKKDNHKDLAMLLQRKEADLILNIVCKKMREKSKTTPVFTIHDCVITFASNLNYLETIIKEELQKSTGNTPNLKQKKWERYE